jgi:hypothetical protein
MGTIGIAALAVTLMAVVGAHARLFLGRPSGGTGRHRRRPPEDVRASFERIVKRVQVAGLERVHEPYIKHIEDCIWEMRLRGRDGIPAPCDGVQSAGGDPPRVREENPEDRATRDRAGTAACKEVT